MGAFLSTVILGLFIVAVGVVNMTGNISTLHWYHRQRVSEEDIKPFCRQVGLGTLICGAACIFFGINFLFYDFTSLVLFIWTGAIGMVAGLAIGIVIILAAIKKYNYGLF